MKMKLAVGDPDLIINGLGAGKEFGMEIFFSKVLKGEKGDPAERSNLIFHDLGESSVGITDLINSLPVFEVSYWDTYRFRVLRNGIAHVYDFRGVGKYGTGEQQIDESQLIDVTNRIGLMADITMSDSSNNVVRNSAIKKYIDDNLTSGASIIYLDVEQASRWMGFTITNNNVLKQIKESCFDVANPATVVTRVTWKNGTGLNTSLYLCQIEANDGVNNRKFSIRWGTNLYDGRLPAEIRYAEFEYCIDVEVNEQGQVINTQTGCRGWYPLDSDQVKNDLTSTEGILSARQGKALDEKKIDKIEGKELSDNNFTDAQVYALDRLQKLPRTMPLYLPPHDQVVGVTTLNDFNLIIDKLKLAGASQEYQIVVVANVVEDENRLHTAHYNLTSDNSNWYGCIGVDFLRKNGTDIYACRKELMIPPGWSNQTSWTIAYTEKLISSGSELVIPIDLRLSYEEREAAILAIVQPLIDDGTFGSKILFGEYIWKKDYTAPDAVVYRVTVPAIAVDGTGVLKYVFGSSIEKHEIEDPDYPYKTEGVISIRSSNNKITYTEQEHQYTDIQVIATENRMFEGTPEGEPVIFTTAQISGLRRVASGLEKGCDVALYYRTDAGLIFGYFEREKGTVDTTKFVFVTGCQWISANEAGELVFHSYKVVSDECDGTANSLFTMQGKCYRTDTVIPKSV